MGDGSLLVVEIAGSTAGAKAASMLALAGAHVVTLEPAGGAPLRRNPAQFTSFCGGRPFVAIDSAEAADLLSRADVVIESDARSVPAELPATLEGCVSPAAVRLVLSPFGSSGPYAHFQSCDLIDQALGGHLYLSGRPDREPLQGPHGQAALAAGVWGAIAVLAALRDRDSSAAGRRVEVTHQESLASMHQFTDVRYSHAGDVLKRMGNRYAGPGSPIGMYPTGDGFIAITVATAAHGETLLAISGMMDLLELPGVTSVLDVMVNNAVLEPALNQWLGTMTTAEAVELMQTVRLAAGPVLTMRQMLDDPHLAERDFWTTVDVDGRSVRMPGAPLRVTPGSVTPPAPSPRPNRAVSKPWRPLEGVRVLDLTRVWAGPLAARILSDLGAEVVMVEASWARTPLVMPQSYVDISHFFPDDIGGDDPWNRHGFINKFAIGKKSVGLDLAGPEGRALFERLVAHADVVIENYSPRVMPNWGLGEDRLHELNPHLIYMTMPGYGRTGPAKDYSAYGPVIDSHAGLSTLMGYPDVPAWKCGIAWPDPVGGIHGAFAVLAALRDRERDPLRRGCTIEIPQFETAITMIADRIVQAQLDDADPAIIGNRHPDYAPHGVYRCAGDDRWVAIAVTSDDEWKSLCALLALPAEWAAWTVLERHTRHDDIDAALSAWTSTHSASAVAVALQDAGVLAAPVADGRDTHHDEHLAARKFTVPLTHPSAGTHQWHGLPFLDADGNRAVPVVSAPCLGEHNASVLRDWLQLPNEEINALVTTGVLATTPPG